LLVLPLVDKQKVFGVLVVHSARSVEGFSEEEISFCQMVANVAKNALRSALRVEISPQGSDENQADNPAAGDFFETRGGLRDMAAHDLRLLVSVIDGYALLLQEADTGNLTPLQKEFIDGLMVGCQRMVEMTNNLLDSSRMEAGKLELAMVETDLLEVIENATREIQSMITRRGIKLVTKSRLDQIITRCDVGNIRRVFYNLMSNAVKFTPQGGEIELFCSADEKEVFVSIADNGPGISSDLFPRLFDDFTHSESPDGQHGNGIGLSICRRIIEAHQGRIWAENLPGKGSRFTFSIPRIK
jgi:signal transduction histidine kinase